MDDIDDMDDMVCVLPESNMPGGGIEDDVIVWERPGGSAAPKILEKAASLWP